MSHPQWTYEVAKTLKDALAEIDRLHDQAVEDRKLSFEWMKKHDRLLGFIQKHPLLLKELIEDSTAPTSEQTADGRE